MSSSVLWNSAVGLAPQPRRSSAQEQQGGPQGKESGACVTFCGQTVLQSSIEDEEGLVVTTCARRLAAWIHPRKEARVGGPYQASHDMEAGTSWCEIADGLSRPQNCIRVGQVGDDGSSCSKSFGTELPSWAAEIQADDHYDPGHVWGCHARN